MIKVAAYVLRAVKLFRWDVTVGKVQRAELKCCFWIQEDLYKDHKKLKAGDSMHNNSHLLTRPLL